MIKNLLIIFCFFTLNNTLFAQFKPISADFRDKIVNSIYLAEGGSKTKYPYGIKSIQTNGNKEFARRICSNTVENNWIRWQKAGKTNDFIEFLGARFCPLSDKGDIEKLNKNWVRNVKYLLSHSDNIGVNHNNYGYTNKNTKLY
jgi:hypothetical protein